MSSPSPGATLLGRFYSERNREYPLDRPLTSLGRARENTIVIRDDRVAPHHACLWREGEDYWLEVTTGEAPTCVNGEEMAPGRRRALDDGDMLRLAGLEFEFQRRACPDPHAPRLCVTAGVHQGKIFRLPQNRALVGRAPENDVQFPDRSVSRRHCAISRGALGWTLEDLGSTNGTLLNWQAIEGAATLRDGDEVTLGFSRFVFQEPASRQEEAANGRRLRAWWARMRTWGVLLFIIGGATTPTVARAAQAASYLADRSFRLPGRGLPGGAEDPVGIAVDRDGRVHVLDRKTGKIFIFNERGQYQKSYPNGNGAFRTAIAFALDDEGRAFVLDGGPRKVVVVGPDGRRAGTIGSPGTGTGQLRRPVDVAVAASGYVYVLDAGYRGILIYSRDGAFIREVRLQARILNPRSLAAGPDGSLYVSDGKTPTALYVLPPFTELPWRGPADPSLKFLRFRGGSFANPTAVATTPSGAVLVLDRSQGRLWLRNPGPSADTTSSDAVYGGPGRGPGAFEQPVDLAPTEDGVVILDAKIRKVERIQLSGEKGRTPKRPVGHPIRVTFGNPQLLPGRLLAARSSSKGTEFVFESSRRGVSRVSSQASRYSTVYGDSATAFLPDPQGFKQDYGIPDLTRAGGVAVNDTFLVVSDPARNRFVAFTVGGADLIGTFGDAYRDNRRLMKPQGLAFLPDGRLLVADHRHDQLKIFSSDLVSLVEAHSFPRPYGVAVDPGGRAYAWSEDGLNLSRRDPASGRWTRVAGQLPQAVSGVAFDPGGNLFVLNRATHQVEAFGPDGQPIFAFGQPGRLRQPASLFLDAAGNVYLVDEGASRTFLYHWHVTLPPPRGVAARYGADGAVLSWTPSGPLASGYNVYSVPGASAEQGEAQPRLLGFTQEPRFTLKAGAAGSRQAAVSAVRVSAVSTFSNEGEPSPAVPVPFVAALSSLQGGDFEGALRYAEQAAEQARTRGDKASETEARWLALSAAVGARRYDRAIAEAQRLRPQVSPPRVADYRLLLAKAQLGRGDHRAAANQLILLASDTAGRNAASRPEVRALSFRITHVALERLDTAGALGFLRNYALALPPGDLRAQVEDSLTVTETRAKLATGLRAWQELEYGVAVRQFENLLANPEANLTTDQRVLTLELLSAAYYGLGRKDDARKAYLRIFEADPSFDIHRQQEQVQRRHGLTVYNDEMLRYFEPLRP